MEGGGKQNKKDITVSVNQRASTNSREISFRWWLTLLAAFFLGRRELVDFIATDAFKPSFGKHARLAAEQKIRSTV